MNSNQISKAVRLALVAGAVSATAAPAAFAADATTDQTTAANQNNTAQLGKIEVTGTRIKRTDVETAQPVTILTSAQLKSTGLTSIGDILQTISQGGAALNTNFNNGGNGRTDVDLRGLGPNRVLVLVDGHRWITGLGGPGNQGVDLNEIPVAIIDHVEILQDGASAIYGSDAISGVVNIITVKNYNGAEANAYTSIFSGEGHHDGKIQEYDFTLGSSGDKGAVVMNVTYSNQHEIWGGSRATSREPVRDGGIASASGVSANGQFFIVGGHLTDGKTFGQGHCAPYNPASHSYGTCDLTVQKTTSKPTLGNFKDFTNADRYNYAPANYFATPLERTSFYTEGHYDIADNLTFNASTSFTRRTSQQILAPSTVVVGSGGSTVNGNFFGVGATNPFNPFGVDLVGNSSQYCTGGVHPYVQDASGNPTPCTGPDNIWLAGGIARRPVETGGRVFNENQETAFFSGGFKGYFNLGGNEWDWDATYSYGSDYGTNITTGLFNTQRLAQALDAPGLTPCAQTAGCVPFNIFGGAGSITPAMLQYTTFEEHDVIATEMRDYTGNINGSLADLPAGPLGFAAGYEYVEFNGFFHPDATVAAGNTTGSAAKPTDGREKTAAQYVEFDIPLVADAPGFKLLDLDVANRWSQFKWAGGIPGTAASVVEHSANATTGRAALKWQPSDTLLVRTAWSQGFRIPSVSELFVGPADSFPPAVDPCAGTPFGGVAPGAALPPGCNGIKHTQQNGQIKSTTGGNSLLHPERAISRTLGFVYNPDWAPGFDFSMDYYKIDLEQQIARPAPQTLLNGCYLAQNPAYCSKITLTGKNITDIQIGYTNLGSIKTSGLDVGTHYKFPSTSVGDFKVGMDWTFLKSFILTSPTGSSNPATAFAHTEFAGSNTSTGGFPKQRANVSLTWNYGDWSAAWLVEYFGQMYEPCTPGVIARGSCSDPTQAINHLGKTIYHDVNAVYHVDSWNTDFTFGIRNLFDKNPPTATTAFQDSFLPSFYRVPGREFYGRISVKF